MPHPIIHHSGAHTVPSPPPLPRRRQQQQVVDQGGGGALMNLPKCQEMKAPFPPGSKVYIYNNTSSSTSHNNSNSHPTIISSGEVVNVLVRLTMTFEKSECEVFYKVKQDHDCTVLSNMNTNNNTAKKEEQGQPVVKIFFHVRENQIRFQNGCSVYLARTADDDEDTVTHIGTEQGEEGLYQLPAKNAKEAIILGTSDVPSFHHHFSNDVDPSTSYSYWYSVMTIPDRTFHHQVSPHHIRYRRGGHDTTSTSIDNSPVVGMIKKEAKDETSQIQYADDDDDKDENEEGNDSTVLTKPPTMTSSSSHQLHGTDEDNAINPMEINSNNEEAQSSDQEESEEGKRGSSSSSTNEDSLRPNVVHQEEEEEEEQSSLRESKENNNYSQTDSSSTVEKEGDMNKTSLECATTREEGTDDDKHEDEDEDEVSVALPNKRRSDSISSCSSTSSSSLNGHSNKKKKAESSSSLQEEIDYYGPSSSSSSPPTDVSTNYCGPSSSSFSLPPTDSSTNCDDPSSLSPSLKDPSSKKPSSSSPSSQISTTTITTKQPKQVTFCTNTNEYYQPKTKSSQTKMRTRTEKNVSSSSSSCNNSSSGHSNNVQQQQNKSMNVSSSNDSSRSDYYYGHSSSKQQRQERQMKEKDRTLPLQHNKRRMITKTTTFVSYSRKNNIYFGRMSISKWARKYLPPDDIIHKIVSQISRETRCEGYYKRNGRTSTKTITFESITSQSQVQKARDYTESMLIDYFDDTDKTRAIIEFCSARKGWDHVNNFDDVVFSHSWPHNDDRAYQSICVQQQQQQQQQQRRDDDFFSVLQTPGVVGRIIEATGCEMYNMASAQIPYVLIRSSRYDVIENAIKAIEDEATLVRHKGVRWEAPSSQKHT